MAPNAGYKTRVLTGEFDLSTYLRSTSVDRARNLIDVTTYTPGAAEKDKEYIAGRRTGTITLAGLFDPETDASDELINAVMDGSEQVVTVSWEGGTAVGQRAVCANVIQSAAPVGVPAEDAVTLGSTRQATGAIKGGVVLHELVEESSAENYSSVDNAALTGSGAVANLHVLEFTGTSATVKVTDSTDDAVFADLITFASVTAAGSERAAATGTVNRYARVEITGTFTTITFLVSFARL